MLVVVLAVIVLIFRLDSRCSVRAARTVLFVATLSSIAGNVLIPNTLGFLANPKANTTAVEDGYPLDLNLRIVWGGSQNASYTGTIDVDQGTIACTQQLGIDPGDPSFMLKDKSKKLAWNDPETRFGGCDVRVQAKSTSLITIRLQIEDPTTAQAFTKEFTWTLSSLRDSPELRELGVNDCRISIDRVPGDRLRIATSRSHLIYNSDEPLNMQMTPYAMALRSSSAVCETSLVRLADEQTLLRRSSPQLLDEFGNGEPNSILWNAPREEGVYELRFKLEPRRTLPGLIHRQPNVERAVQFVVYNNSPWTTNIPSRSMPESAAQHAWSIVSRVPLPSFELQTLTNKLLGQLEGPRRFPFLELSKSFTIGRFESTARGAHPALDSDPVNGRLSIPPVALASAQLSGLVPGELHRVLLTSPNQDTSCRIMIASPKSRGDKTWDRYLVEESIEIAPSHVVRALATPGDPVPREVLEVWFWPTARTATLDIVNLHSVKELTIAEAQVEVWRESNEVRESARDPKEESGAVLELHSANIRSTFGLDGSTASENPLERYDDWNLYLQFANRVGSYCQANGFRKLALTVHSEGGTLFPSTKLSSNARFDTGTFSRDGRDPMKKDIVELMYRSMPRMGIEFVPMLEWNSPIREIEEALIRSEDTELLQERRGALAGRSANDHRYNPLCSLVQRAIAAAIDEFETRYASHPSYHGFAIRIDESSHLDISLPVSETNLSILDGFAASIGGKLPHDEAQRDAFIYQRALSMFQQWHRSSVTDLLSSSRRKPRWISKPIFDSSSVLADQVATIVPLELNQPSRDPKELCHHTLIQWHANFPTPVHIAIDQNVVQTGSSFVQLIRIAEPFYSQQVRSVRYRDNGQSISKVRIWQSEGSKHGLLIANSGAVLENIHIVWDQLPFVRSVASTWTLSDADSANALQVDSQANEWAIAIPAGEAVRIEWKEDLTNPLHWYSQESSLLNTLDVSLQSLEHAVGRLSTPQPSLQTLSNAGFEAPNTSLRRGRIPGWVTSIDPNASVSIDTNAASRGQSSVTLHTVNPTAIAWLQSDPFAVVSADRFFVSFQALASRVPAQVTVSLWQLDPKTDRFESIASRDVAARIPAAAENAKWSNVCVDMSKEIVGLLKDDTANLFRIQFETRGAGSLWLDDVFLSSVYLREEEQRDIRSELFLARSSLQKGDSSPAVAMLTSSRGRLMQWGDTTSSKPTSVVSTQTIASADNGLDEKRRGTPPEVPRNGQPKPESKLKTKRLRDYLWQR